MYIAFAKYLFEGTIFIEVIRILVVMQCCVTLKMMLTAEGCRYDYFFWVCFCSDIRAFWFGYCCHYSLLWIFSPFAISFMMIMVTLIKSWHITRFVLFLCKSIILLSLLIKSIRNISVFLMYSLLSCFSPNDDIVIFRTHRKSTTHYQFKWFQTGAFQCIFVTCTVRQLHFDLLKKSTSLLCCQCLPTAVPTILYRIMLSHLGGVTDYSGRVRTCGRHSCWGYIHGWTLAPHVTSGR